MTTSASRAVLAGLLGMLPVGLMTSCGGGTPSAEDPSRTRPPTATVEYAHGLSEDIYLPHGRTRGPLLVLVPGGSWTTSDPIGLAGLSARLSEAGIAAAPTEIRASADGVLYPTPVDDVLCAAAAAVQRARSHHFTPGPIAVLGHSSGAHLAALAVLAADDFSPTCSAPLVTPDALIGLSGPYDISQVPELAVALLGSDPEDDPATWANANPVDRADLRPDVPVLLLHGDADTTVPIAFTNQFAQALEGAGHPMTVKVIPRADHDTIYRSDVAARPVARWLRRLDD